MNESPGIIQLDAMEEANRLRSGAKEAEQGAANDFVAMCTAMELGLRAAEILVTHRLQPVKEHFPATIGIQLDTPDPGVEAHRDAVNVPNSLSFTAILDLLSGDDMECVAPGLHRGWEDRRFSCRRSRITAREALGLTLTETDRESLLALSAYRNRIFRAPPPVRVVRDEILNALPALNRLLDGLG